MENNWVKNLKVGDLILTMLKPMPNPKWASEDCKMGGNGFTPSRILTVKFIHCLPHMELIHTDERKYGIFSNSCHPIKIPKEGKMNLKEAQPLLTYFNSTKECKSPIYEYKNYSAVAWNENSYWYVLDIESSSKKEYKLKDLIINNSNSLKEKSYDNKEHKTREIICKIDRVIPTIRRGVEPRGETITGRTSRIAIKKRCISYSTSIIKS